MIQTWEIKPEGNKTEGNTAGRAWAPDAASAVRTWAPDAASVGGAVAAAKEMVNRPDHYAPNGRDSFMHMKDQMGADAFDGFLQGNVIKYVQRYKFKGKPVEDLNKAFFYLAHLFFEAGGCADALAKTLSHARSHFAGGLATGRSVTR